MRPCVFPRLQVIDRQQVVGVGAGLRRAVDDARGTDDVLHRQRIGRAVRQVAPGDPVYGCVEVRAGVLVAREIVPVPADRPRRTSTPAPPSAARIDRIAGQLERRKFGRQGLREIDDLDAAFSRSPTRLLSVVADITDLRNQGERRPRKVPQAGDAATGPQKSGAATPYQRGNGRRPHCSRRATRGRSASRPSRR